MNSCAADRAEVKYNVVAALGDANVCRRVTDDPNLLASEMRLIAKRASGATLTSQAVADAYSNRFAIGG
jgi:hypothetical protein